MDFINDLIKLIKDKYNINHNNYNSRYKEECLSLYLEYIHRRISINKRKTHISIELKNKIFKNNKYNNILKELCKISENGGSLMPYQSRFINKIDFAEFLLFDWNIHHLHLGVLEKDKEFSTRTGDLLFCYINDNNIYFIDILNHHSFADINLLEILSKNWPHLIQNFILKGITKSDVNLNDEERIRLRKSGINSIITLSNGTILAPLGFGISTAKTSLLSTYSSDQVIKYFRNIQSKIELSFLDISTFSFKFIGINEINGNIIINIEKIDDSYKFQGSMEFPLNIPFN